MFQKIKLLAIFGLLTLGASAQNDDSLAIKKSRTIYWSMAKHMKISGGFAKALGQG